MKKVKSKRGGARAGAGAKPKADKKIVFFIYPLQSRIEKLGKELAKEVSIAAIEKEFKKYLK